MQFYTAADIAGAGAKVQLSTKFSQTLAKEILLGVVSGAAGVRFGDVNVGAAQGVFIPASVNPAILRTSVADETDKFDLTTCYVFIPAGVTLSLAIGY